MASLLGTGVESFVDGFGLGRELALVVSCKHEERLGSGETLLRAAGEDAATGDDFWKKLMMDRCFAEAVAEPAGLGAGFAGVRAVLEPSLSPAMVISILEPNQTVSISRRKCWER